MVKLVTPISLELNISKTDGYSNNR